MQITQTDSLNTQQFNHATTVLYTFQKLLQQQPNNIISQLHKT